MLVAIALLGSPVASALAQSASIDYNRTLTSVLDATGDTVTVGDTGTGSLTINAGHVLDAYGILGASASAIGTAILNRPASSWQNSGNFDIGQYGTGTLLIEMGSVTDAAGYMGMYAGSHGTATVIGSMSSWTTSGTLWIGQSGTAVLTVSNGGAVSDVTAYLNGTASVDGNGSRWISSSNLSVGTQSNGTLTISNGGVVSGLDATIGRNPGVTGTVSVDSGANWTITGDLLIGHQGTGTLTVANGATVAAGLVVIANASGSTGTLVIGAAPGSTAVAPGTFSASSISFGSGAGKIVFNHTDADYVFGAKISGAGSIEVDAGTTLLSAANTYSGGTTLTGGTITIGNSSALGTGTLSMAPGTTLAFADTGDFTLANAIKISGDPTFTPPTGTVQTIAGVIADGASPGTLEMTGAGTLVLSAVNTYTGATNVNAGTLEIDGSIASSSLTSVNSGATLSGIGIVGATLVNPGGSLRPGTSAPGTLTVSGNLTMSFGSFYGVQISPAQSSRTQVNGTATLNGATVVVTPQLGTYAAHTYTILTATNPLSDRFNSAVMVTRAGVISAPTLSYDGNHAYLSVQAYTGLITLPDQPAAGGRSDTYATANGLPVPYNAQNIATGINHFILAGGTLPSGYQGLGTLSGATLVNALDQLAGQSAASVTPIGFAAGTMFLDLMLNPFIDGRSDGRSAAQGADFLAYAPDSPATRDAASIFGRFDRAALKAAVEPLYGVWAAAYGGAGSISGSATTGAAGLNAGIAGLAAGLDYHLAPSTTIGFALGGGGANWTLAQALGSGHSGIAQAGFYARNHFGRAYVSGALAYSWQDVSASRLVALAGSDTLNSNFGANTASGHLEAGYRLPVDHLPFGILPQSRLGITPYGALQAQGMFLPPFAEYPSAGSAQFALRYAGRDYSVVRVETGAWFECDIGGIDQPLKLTSRAAFAHDFENESTAVAMFQQLPGSAILINAAKPAANGALITAGLEYRLADGWSLLGKFDGEFSRTTSIYAGTGMLRKTW